MTDPLHVLVVDDEPRIRTMLRRYLVEEGFKVSDAAVCAGKGTVRFGGVNDLVLLDLMMPGEDGLSLARHIRQAARSTRPCGEVAPAGRGRRNRQKIPIPC